MAISLLNEEQMSNKVGVEHQPATMSHNTICNFILELELTLIDLSNILYINQ